MACYILIGYHHTIQCLLEVLGTAFFIVLILNPYAFVIEIILLILTVIIATVSIGPDNLYSLYLYLTQYTVIRYSYFLLLFLILSYVTFFVCDLYFLKPSVRGGGNRRANFFRRSLMWKYAADYFPMHLIKTADLDPKKNYVMGYHPHGIMSHGAAIGLGTEALNFEELFPGITPHVTTLKLFFQAPLTREMALGCGMSEVSKENIEWILTRLGSGNAVVIVVGGIREVLLTRQGAHRLVIKDRKGFIRMAIRTGSSLVPVYAFGENELHTVADGVYAPGLYERFVMIIEKLVDYTCPEINGSSVGLLNRCSAVPFRRSLYIVVGRPIPVDQCSNPDESQVEDVHMRYMKDLKQLFDDHKHKYDDNPTAELEFI